MAPWLAPWLAPWCPSFSCFLFDDNAHSFLPFLFFTSSSLLLLHLLAAVSTDSKGTLDFSSPRLASCAELDQGVADPRSESSPWFLGQQVEWIQARRRRRRRRRRCDQGHGGCLGVEDASVLQVGGLASACREKVESTVCTKIKTVRRSRHGELCTRIYTSPVVRNFDTFSSQFIYCTDDC